VCVPRLSIEYCLLTVTPAPKKKDSLSGFIVDDEGKGADEYGNNMEGFFFSESQMWEFLHLFGSFFSLHIIAQEGPQIEKICFLFVCVVLLIHT